MAFCSFGTTYSYGTRAAWLAMNALACLQATQARTLPDPCVNAVFEFTHMLQGLETENWGHSKGLLENMVSKGNL
jgi:hypothetical protein